MKSDAWLGLFTAYIIWVIGMLGMLFVQIYKSRKRMKELNAVNEKINLQREKMSSKRCLMTSLFKLGIISGKDYTKIKMELLAEEMRSIVWIADA